MIPALLALLGQTAGAYDCQGHGEFTFATMYHNFLDEVRATSLGEAVEQRGKVERLQEMHAAARLALDEAAKPIKVQLGLADAKCLQQYNEMERRHHSSQDMLDNAIEDLLTKAQSTCFGGQLGEFDAVIDLQAHHTEAAHALDGLDLGRSCKVDPGRDYLRLSSEHDCARYKLDESVAKLFAMHARAC
jgi:hypothetical protein